MAGKISSLTTSQWKQKLFSNNSLWNRNIKANNSTITLQSHTNLAPTCNYSFRLWCMKLLLQLEKMKQISYLYNGRKNQIFLLSVIKEYAISIRRQCRQNQIFMVTVIVKNVSHEGFYLYSQRFLRF